MIGGLSNWQALLWVAVAVGGGGRRCCSRRAGAPAAVARASRCARSSAAALFGGYVALGRRSSSCCGRATGTSWSPGSRGGHAGARHRAAAVRQRRPVAADRARAARRRAADPRRAADVLAALGAGRRRRARRSRCPTAATRSSRSAVLIIVVASPVVSLGGPRVAAARAGAGRAVGLLPVARAAPAAARARGRGAARDRAGRRAAAGGDGRPRRAVVRLPRVRREPRARRSGALLVDAELRADRLAAQRQRGDAGHARASRCTGRRATSTCSTAARGRSATSPPRTRAATSRSRPTSRRTGTYRPAWTEHGRLQHPPRADDRGLRRRHDDPRSTTRRARSQPALSPGTWDAPSGLRRGDSYTVEVRVPQPSVERAWRTARRACASARTASAQLIVPFRPGKRAPVQHHRPPGRTVPTEAEVTLRAVGRRRARGRQLPGRQPRRVRPRRGDGAVGVRAHVGAVASGCKRGRRATRWTTSAPSTTYLRRPEFRYVERPPQPAAGRRAARLLPQRLAPGLLPALRGRDGAAAADGRAAGARRDRASRPAATRSATRPGSCATPTRTRGSRSGSTSTAGSRSTRRRPRPRPARRSRRWRRRRRATPLVPDRGPGGVRRGGRVRRPSPASARSCRSARATARPAAAPAGRSLRWLRVVRRSRCSCSRRLLARAAVPPPPARQDADGPRDRGGRGRDAPRRAAGHDRHDARPARRAGSARTRRRSRRTCARWPRAATGWCWVPPPRAGRRRCAPRVGQRPRVHRRRCGRWWAMPPRFERRAASRARGVRGRDQRSRLARRVRSVSEVVDRRTSALRDARKRARPRFARSGSRANDHARSPARTTSGSPRWPRRNASPMIDAARGRPASLIGCRSPAHPRGESRSPHAPCTPARARRADLSAARYAPSRSNGTPRTRTASPSRRGPSPRPRHARPRPRTRACARSGRARPASGRARA